MAWGGGGPFFIFHLFLTLSTHLIFLVNFLHCFHHLS